MVFKHACCLVMHDQFVFGGNENTGCSSLLGFWRGGSWDVLKPVYSLISCFALVAFVFVVLTVNLKNHRNTNQGFAGKQLRNFCKPHGACFFS